MSSKSHWDQIYSSKQKDQMSWTQTSAALSLELLHRAGVMPDSNIIDVGGGISVFIDALLSQNFTAVTVLEISSEAIKAAKKRLGDQANRVTWIEGDVTTAPLPKNRFDLWHDRAVFHFLTKPEQRKRYLSQVLHALKPGGFLLIATFSLDGPEKCSGLEVVRYSPETLQSELGPQFKLIETRNETHVTPWNSNQQFVYCLLKLNLQTGS